MSDIKEIGQVGSSRLYEKPVTLKPVYLIEGTSANYLATRIDDNDHYLRLVGLKLPPFATAAKEVDLKKNFQKMLDKTDKALYEEVMLPWHHVTEITNLTFKHK